VTQLINAVCHSFEGKCSCTLCEAPKWHQAVHANKECNKQVFVIPWPFEAESAKLTLACVDCSCWPVLLLCALG
jgi:hypothetical protein